jgi:hypothetical protein
MRAPSNPSSLRIAQALVDRDRRLAEQQSAEPQSMGRGSPAAGAKEARPATPPSSPASDRFAAIFDEAQRRAALSGSFAPDDLFSGDVDRKTRQLVLSRLSPICDFVPGSSAPRWTLLNAPRAAILQKLSTNDFAKQFATELPQTDDFGAALREVLLLGEAVKLERDLPALLDLSKAVEAIAPLEVPKPDLDRLRQMIERASFLKDFDTLLGRGVIGRDKEREELADWVESPNARSSSWDGLLLTGLGGAGKSTLLVSFLQSLVREGKAVIALLDFDRPGVNPTDTTWIEFEISRQVGYQLPILEGELRSVRQELRDLNRRPGQYGSDFEKSSSERSNRSLMRTMRNRLVDRGSTTFVLALDTFETVVERDLQGKLVEWLYYLGDALASINLKVIFSGRIFEGKEPLFGGVAQKRIVVGELEPADATTLLGNFKIELALAERIARSDVLPRRPLELRLLAQLIERDPRTDLDKLERELREGGPAAQELFAGLVYRRILERLPDGPARDLAYPGLILRYLTVEILTDVLAPALAMQELTPDQARRALDDLTNYDWLVYRRGDQVWHRSDLRRSTLAPMLSSDRQRTVEIRKRAIEYFERTPVSGTPRPERLAEALYHRLMRAEPSDQGDEYDLQAIRRLLTHIEQSSAELPPTGAALLKLARGEPLSVDRIDVLPVNLRATAADEVGRRLVADREFGKAFALHDRTRSDSRSADPADEIAVAWRREAAFATAHWADLSENRLPPPPHDRHGLETLGRLYPYELAAPTDVPAREVSSMLSADFSLLKKPARTRRPGAADEIQRRIAIIAMLVSARDSFDARERRVLHELVKLFVKQRTGATGDASLAWLARVARSRMSFRVTLRAFNVCLDRNWLEGFGERAKAVDPSKGAITMVAGVKSIVDNGSSPSARMLLGNLDVLDNVKQRPYFKFRDESDTVAQWWTLRGPCPELRNPVRFALLDRFATPAAHEELAAIIQHHLDVELEDLAPARFAETMASTNAEEALASYVELVDRHWRLRTLVDDCADRRPGGLLDAVRVACHRWEDGVRLAMLGADAVATLA